MIPEDAVAVGLVGHARSGKSTLAYAVASLLPHAAAHGFGEIVRARAAQLGLDLSDRNVLIDIGARWVATDPAGMCAAVLRQFEPAVRWLVIDGIRHDHIADEMARQLAPARLILAYLDAPLSLLLERFAASGVTEQDALALLADVTEVEIDGPLRRRADLVLDANESVEANARALVKALKGSEDE